MKEIEDTMEMCPTFIISIINIVKMSVLQKAIYGLNATLIKIPMGSFDRS